MNLAPAFMMEPNKKKKHRKRMFSVLFVVETTELESVT